MAEHQTMQDFTQEEQNIINAVIDKPYSEMTEEQIELVTEWKACEKASTDTYQQILKANDAAIAARQATDKAASDLSAEEYDRIVEEVYADLDMPVPAYDDGDSDDDTDDGSEDLIDPEEEEGENVEE